MAIAIDLFCGAGGMSEGILQAGFHIVYSSDKSEEAGLTYQNRHQQLGLIQGVNTFYETEDIKNLTGKHILNKIKELEIYKGKKIPKIDAIFGGPPCQGFSRAGKRKENDPRNFLFREYLRVISEICPKYIVMENVVGILDTKLNNFVSFDGEIYQGNVFVTNILEKELKKLKYEIKNYNEDNQKIDFKNLIVDASKFGVPQKRERVIIIGYSEGEKEPRNIKNYICKKTNVKEAISDLIVDSKIREKNLYELVKEKKDHYIKESIAGRTPSLITKKSISREGTVKNNELSNHFDYITERFSLFREGESAKNVKERLLMEGISNISNIPNLIDYTYNIFNKTNIYKNKKEFYKDLKKLTKLNKNLQLEIIETLMSKKNIRIKLNSEEVARTIVTIHDDYISPFENRTFSVREMARLQSFDDSFIFLGKRTTGGERRKMEVPQYTQVGNAVPPLLAKAIASSIYDVLKH